MSSPDLLVSCLIFSGLSRGNAGSGGPGILRALRVMPSHRDRDSDLGRLRGLMVGHGECCGAYEHDCR